MSHLKPSLCFVGHMLGRHAGYVTTQGQIVADLFSKNGYPVHSVSSQVNRVFRLVDMITTVIRGRRTTDILIVEVYSGLSFIMADAVSMAGKYLKIPMVGVLHGGNLPDFIKRFPRWTLRILRRFDELIAPSAFLANEMEERGFRTFVIPNVIDLDAYPFKLRRDFAPKLIWMRAFHSIYNPEMALGVLEIVRRTRPDATLVMAGAEKGIESNIKRMAKEMGLEEAVRFPGFLEHEAKIREFSEADIYLNTNKIDNMPVAVVEARAMGLPVVATNVGGLSQLISDGENGLPVPDGDVQAMANAVHRLLNDPDLSCRISENGRALAERSAWASVRKCWDELFTELLVRKSRKKTEPAPSLFETPLAR